MENVFDKPILEQMYLFRKEDFEQTTYDNNKEIQEIESEVYNINEKLIILLKEVISNEEDFKKVKNKPKSIYIYANNSTIKERLINRGDDHKEAQRRLEHDNIDFKGVETEVDKIVYNNKGSNINDVVNKILKYLEES